MTASATRTLIPLSAIDVLYLSDFEAGEATAFRVPGFTIRDIDGNAAYCGQRASPFDLILPAAGSDYSIEAKVNILKKGTGHWWVELWGRTRTWNTGYALFVDARGNRYEVIGGSTARQLGRLSLPINLDTWYTLRLDLKGDQISAFVNSQQVGDAGIDGTYGSGSAGISFGNVEICIANIVVYTPEGIATAVAQTPTQTLTVTPNS